jgi:hypothetical protein
MEIKQEPLIQGTLNAATELISEWLATYHGPNIKVKRALNVIENNWALRWHIPELILTEEEIQRFQEADLDNSNETPLEKIALAKANLLAIDGKLFASSSALQGTCLDIKLDRRSVFEKIEDESQSLIEQNNREGFFIEKDLKWLMALVGVVLVAGLIESYFLH